MAANFASQPALFEVSGHVALIGGCSMEDVLVRRFGTLGIVNLSIQPNNHAELLKNSVVSALVDEVVSIQSEGERCIAYMESTVVDISMTPQSFKPSALLFLHSPLSKTPKKVFFLTQ